MWKLNFVFIKNKKTSYTWCWELSELLVAGNNSPEPKWLEYSAEDVGDGMVNGVSWCRPISFISLSRIATPKILKNR